MGESFRADSLAFANVGGRTFPLLDPVALVSWLDLGLAARSPFDYYPRTGTRMSIDRMLEDLVVIDLSHLATLSVHRLRYVQGLLDTGTTCRRASAPAPFCPGYPPYPH